MLDKFRYCVLLIFLCNHLSKACSLGRNSNLNICREEKTTTINGTFEWKINYNDGVNYILSQPDVCWENGKIVLRRCDFENGEWFPNQVKCSKFQRKNTKCPDDLTEIFVNNEFVCLKISTKKHIFDERYCYGTNFVIGYNSDSMQHEILNFILKKYKITSFWMPIKRFEDNEFNPFVIRLPGKHWNELYIFRGGQLATSNQMLSGKHCLVAYIRKHFRKPNETALQIEMSHCGDLHYSVCVIEKHFIAKSGCPQDFGSLVHRPNECYGITWDGQKFPQDFRMLDVNEYFKKVNTINIIFKELNIVNNKWVEVDGAIGIPDGKWAIKPKTNEIKIASSRKKINGLCVEYIERRKNVEMILRMDSDPGSLILTVYNKFYIWSNIKPEDSIYCFTNADYEELSKVDLEKIWENDSQTKTIFKVNIKNDDTGQYWCEAHTIFNFTHISSSKVIAAKEKKGHAFAIQIEVPMKHYQFPILFTPDEMKHIATCIKKDMKNVRKNDRNLNDLVIHNVRIMDIFYIHPNGSYMRCICHTTVSVKSSAIDTSKEENNEEDNLFESEEGLIKATTVRMRAKNLLVYLMNTFQTSFVHTVRSNEFCFPENEWLLARIGQSTTKSKLCLQKNGLPITRRCLGEFIAGAYWEEITIEDCVITAELNLITRELYSIEKTTTSEEQLEKNVRNVRNLLEPNLKNIIPADLYYLAKIIRNSINGIFKAVTTPLTQQVQLNRLDTLNNRLLQLPWASENLSKAIVEIIRIFNDMLEVNKNVFGPSITLNSTNILLEAFEYLIDHISSLETFSPMTSNGTNRSVYLQHNINHDNKEIEIIEYLDMGVVVKIATNFLVFVISPQVANVTGIALFQGDSKSSETFYDEGLLKGAFKTEYYRFIFANQSVDQLLNAKNILLGTFVPSSLWQRLDEISLMSNRTWQAAQPEPKIVIKIYANDKLFQETNIISDKVVDGKIISLSIPGHDRDLPENLPLILTGTDLDEDELKYNKDFHEEKQFCRYWNYQTWARDGVMVINRSELNNNTVLCGCTHLTPFAYLIGGSYNLSVNSDVEIVEKKVHKQALDIITLLGCSLSFFGIVGIFITACIFPSWRKKANSKVLLQFSAAIALQMIIFCFVNTEEITHRLISNQIYTSCIAIGACLHYSVLVQFCWMVIIAYLQFKRYVQVFGNTRPRHFFIKSTILGWVLPSVPVAFVLMFDSGSYIPQQGGSTNPLCYPSGISFYLGIVLPITVVIIANLIIFFIVIYNILKSPAGAIRHTDKSLVLSQLRLLGLLFFLLGFTWIFGLLNAMKAGLVFSYLFCLTATLQGFILFLYFVVMDPITRRMWYRYFMQMCGLYPNVENSSSVKETTF